MRSGNVIEYSVHRFLRIFPALCIVVLLSMLALGPALTTFSLVSYFSDHALLLYAKNMLTLAIRYLPGVTSRDGRPVIINGALWTLHFEVLSYAALALMYKLQFLRRRGLFLILYVASYATYVIMNLEPETVAVLPERFAIFMSLFVYFIGGTTLYIFRDRIPFSAALAFGAAVTVVIALPHGLGPIFLPLCLPYIVIVCGLSVLPGESLLKRDLSYGIYLIHAPLLVVFRFLFPDVRIWWVGALVVIVGASFLAYLSWTFVEAPILAKKKNLSNWINYRIDAVWGAWNRSDKAQISSSNQM